MSQLTSYAKALLAQKPSERSLVYIDTPDALERLDTLQEAGRAEINVGHACPHRCVFCMQGHGTVDQKQWVPLDKMKAEIDYYRYERGFHRLGFLGGEPTVYPHIIEALQYAKSVGFTSITINTNAWKFADYDFARQCVEAGLTRPCMSIHGHTAGVEDTLSGSAGSLVRKVKAIYNFRRLQREGSGLEGLSMNPVLNKLNLPTMVEFIEFYLKLGVDDIRFNYIRPEGRAAESKEIIPGYTEAMPHIMRVILKNERDWNADITFGEVPWCQWPAEIFENDYLRGRYIGEFRDTRTIVTSYKAARAAENDGKRRFVWQELKRNVLKTYVPACRKCPVREVCGGVWRNYGDLYGGAEFHPIEWPASIPAAALNLNPHHASPEAVAAAEDALAVAT